MQISLANRFLFVFLCFIYSGFAINYNSKDSSVFVPIINIDYSFQLSSADLAKKFGNSSAISSSFAFKTKNNLWFGLSGSYFFGKDVKATLFQTIASKEGNIIGLDGNFADIKVFERGLTIMLDFGKLFPVLKDNKNSGILCTIGTGYIQHKNKIMVDSEKVPQLSDEYLKGYDKLTGGLAFKQFVGFLFLSNNRLVNCFAGIECMQGFTSSLRSYDYDLMGKDNSKYFDMLVGLKMGWSIPLYKREPDKFYYY